MVSKILSPVATSILIRPGVYDANVLIKQAKSNDFWERFELKKTLIVALLPNHCFFFLGHLIYSLTSLLLFQSRVAAHHLACAKADFKLIFHYTIALLPTSHALKGLSSAAAVKQTQNILQVQSALEEMQDAVKYIERFPIDDEQKKTHQRFIEQKKQCESELKSQGFISEELITATAHDFIQLRGDNLYKHDRTAQGKFITHAVSLFPKKQEIREQLQRDMSHPPELLESKPDPLPDRPALNENQKVLSLFAAMNGNFALFPLQSPQSADVATYVLNHIQDIDRASDAPLKKALIGSDHRLQMVKNEFQTLADTEKLRERHGYDHKKYAQALIDKVIKDKRVLVQSGFQAEKQDNPIYLLFECTTKGTDHFISAKMLSMGREASPRISQGTERIYTQTVLKETPAEALKESLFWKPFLELRTSRSFSGVANDWTLNDFQLMLSKWPGGTREKAIDSKKPQFTPTATFRGLASHIREVLGPKYDNAFMLSLYVKNLTECTQKLGVTDDSFLILKEVTDHLARRMSKSLKQHEKLAQALLKELKQVEEKITAFEKIHSEASARATLPLAELRHDKAKKPWESRYTFTQNVWGLRRHIKVSLPGGSLKHKIYHILGLRDRSVFWYGSSFEGKEKLAILKRGAALLPSIHDPAWKRKDKDLLAALDLYLHQLNTNVTDLITEPNAAPQIGPNDAAFAFKIFTAKLKQVFHADVDPTLRSFYLSRIKSVLLSDSLELMRPTQPEALKAYLECIDFLLEETKDLPVVDNLSLTEIKVSRIQDLGSYPHLKHLHDLIKNKPELKAEIINRIQEIKKTHEVPGDLECVQFIYNYSDFLTLKKYPEIQEWNKLLKTWMDFYTQFGLRSDWKSLSLSGYWDASQRLMGTYVFTECYKTMQPDSYAPSELSQIRDKKSCQRELFLDSFRGIDNAYDQKEMRKLLAILDKKHPFSGKSKEIENEHLTHVNSFKFFDEKLPFHELQSLLSLTLYKNLSIDLITKHFDRFFPRLKSVRFQTLFQLLLTRVFVDEGKTHNLITYGIQHQKEQISGLLDFIKRRRADADRLERHELTAFLFWIEGLILSHFYHDEAEVGEDIERVYESYVTELGQYLERKADSDPAALNEVCPRILGLTTYFENTPKKGAFLQFVKESIGNASPAHSMNEAENRELEYALTTFSEHFTPEAKTKLIKKVSLPFSGTYTFQPEAKVTNSFDDDAFHPFIKNTLLTAYSDMRFYQSSSHSLIFRGKEKHPAFLCDRGIIERLEEGKQTGLFLATDYHINNPLYYALKRLSLSRDLFLWKDSKNRLMRADLPKLNLSFQFEEGVRRGEGHWMSSEHPGFYLDTSFQHPLFGSHDAYITLRNGEGKRIVYTRDPSPANPSNAPYEGGLLTYHFDSSGEIDLANLTPEALVYGVCLGAKTNQPHLTELFMKEWEKERPLHNTRTESFIMALFDQQSDFLKPTPPRLAAIRLKLALSLYADPLYDPKDLDGLFQRIFQDYCITSQQGNNTFPFSLSAADEKILATIRTKLWDRSTFAYLIATHLPKIEKFKNFFGLQGENIETSFAKEALTFDEKVETVMRPQALIDHFFSFYQMAKEQKKDKPCFQQLQFLLEVSDYAPSHDIQTCRNILQAVMDCPYAFPAVEEVLLQKSSDLMTDQQIIINLSNKAHLISLVNYIVSTLCKVLSFSLVQDIIIVLIRDPEALLNFLQIPKEFHEKTIKGLLLALSVVLTLAIPYPSIALHPNVWINSFANEFIELLIIGATYKLLPYFSAKKALQVYESGKMGLSRWKWSSSLFGLHYRKVLRQTEPKKLFTPALTFQAQVSTPLETLIHEQDAQHPLFIEKTKDVAKDLEALNDIEETFTKAASEIEEPSVQSEHNAFLEGVEQKKAALREEETQTTYEIDLKRVGTLVQKLKAKQGQYAAKTQLKKDEILKLIRNYSTQVALEVQGRVIRELTFEEIVVAFGRGDDRTLLRSNPSLKKDDYHKIKNLIGSYLIEATYQKQLEGALAKLERAEMLKKRMEEENAKWMLRRGFDMLRGIGGDAEKDQNEIKSLLTESVDLLKAKRVFSAHKSPELLVFEYFMDIYLRQNQMDFLERALQAKGDPEKLKHLLLEAHTGFGKSKVAIPLWLFLTSQTDRLSMITVPEPLFQEMKIHLRRVLGTCFDQGVISLEFDRARSNDLRYLTYLSDLLERAQKEGKCIALTINSLHGLATLKHKELYYQSIHGEVSPKHFAALDKIRGTLAHQVSNFIDEATECLRPDFFYDYSVGQPKQLQDSYIETTKELLELIVSDPELQKEMDFDFTDLPKKPLKDQKYVDHTLYETKIVPLLIQKVIAHMDIPAGHRDAAKRSLKGEYGTDCENLFLALTEVDRRKFAIFRTQIMSILEQSLTCRWGERYVLGKDRIAYPARHGKIIPRSQFSSLDLVLNLTFQANIKTPFTLEHVEEFIETLITNSASKPKTDFEYSIEYVQFKGIIEGHNFPPFNDFKKANKEAFLKLVNSSYRYRMLFTQGFVMPKLEFFPKKINSFPQLVCNRLGHVQGASGTLSRNVPNQFDLLFDRKTIFKNLLALWQKSQDQVFTIPKTEGKPLVQNLFRNFSSKFNVIIDAAGYFRGFSSREEIAKLILKETAGRRRPSVDAVIYIDESGNQMILQRGSARAVLRSNSSISKDRVFMFYPQEAAVGFDIDLSRESKALVTVSRKTRRNFFMQAVGRMRGLDKDMSASFVTFHEELEAVREELKLPTDHKFHLRDLFVHFFNKEGEKQGDEAFNVLFYEWLGKIEELFWSKDVKIPLKRRLELFKKLENLFVKNVFEHPVRKLRSTKETIPIQEAIQEQLEDLLKIVEELTGKAPLLANRYATARLRAEFEALVDKTRLRSTHTRAAVADQEISFSEVEQQQEQQQELELINDLSHSRSLRYRAAKPEGFKKPYEEISQYEKVRKYHSNDTDFISDDLLCSPNFFKIADNRKDLYRTAMKPARHALLIQNRQTKRFKMVLLDVHDAQYLLGQMQSDKKAQRTRSEQYNFYLVGNDNLNVIAQNGEDTWDPQNRFLSDLSKLRRQASPYTGRLVFDAHDKQHFEETGDEHVYQFARSIESRFGRPWPFYTKSLDTLRRMVT